MLKFQGVVLRSTTNIISYAEGSSFQHTVPARIMRHEAQSHGSISMDGLRVFYSIDDTLRDILGEAWTVLYVTGHGGVCHVRHLRGSKNLVLLEVNQ
jgi:hypothetical protein